MRELGIDVETYSDIPLLKCGLYRYVQDPSFEILLFGYRWDDGPPIVVDLKQGEEVPEEVCEALRDPEVKKTAWNAQFELAALNEYEEFQTPVNQWECTMVKASMLSFPLDLDRAGHAMGLTTTKDKTGKALVKYFTMPNKPTKTNPNVRHRNLPEHDMAKWKSFKSYCGFDVEVEKLGRQRIGFYTIPKKEILFWQLDQKINARGVKLDKKLVTNAIQINKAVNDKLFERVKKITALPNPNSLPQLKGWLEKQTGTKVKTLSKDTIPDLLEEHKDRPEVVKVLKIREKMSKSSIKKYIPMYLCASRSDWRARGLLQFFGANKTGRWASRLIQLQNLVRNKMKDLDMARNLVLEGDLDGLEMLFGNVPNVMSQLCRTAFIPEKDKQFLVSDFAAIEARVLAWFANEEWKLEVFRTHGKIYEAAGSQMFKLPIEEIKGEVRLKAKIAELALGYQGGVGALDRMGALKMGLTYDELQPLVDAWRAANPKIVKLWYGIDRAAITAVQNPGMVVNAYRCKFIVKHRTLFLQLPSGRFIAYYDPHMRENKFGKQAISYYGVDQKTRKWSRQDTYGGKLVENIVQAASRDLLCEKMLELDQAGYDIAMHVHDEVVCETCLGNDEKRIKYINEIMSKPIDWADGLPLGAASFTTPYYIKD